jgi:glycine C-acetyltransferase
MLLSQTMADELLKKEFMLLVLFPVVPKDKARIRVQLSAHTKEHLDKAIAAFIEVGQSLNV